MPNYLIESYLPRSRAGELTAAARRVGAQRSSLPAWCRQSAMHQEAQHEDPEGVTGLAVCAAIVTGCGEDEDVQAARPTVSPAERQAQLERNP
jgi:hypothetical protein